MFVPTSEYTAKGSRKVLTSFVITLACTVGVLFFALLTRAAFRQSNHQSAPRTLTVGAWALALGVFYGSMRGTFFEPSLHLPCTFLAPSVYLAPSLHLPESCQNFPELSLNVLWMFQVDFGCVCALLRL